MEYVAWGLWAFSLWVSGLKVVCVPYRVLAQWVVELRLLENLGFIFLRTCTISCIESLCERMRYGGRGLWYQRSEKRLFCFLLLKGTPCFWVRLGASPPVDQRGGSQRWLPIPISWVGLQKSQGCGPQPRWIKSEWGWERGRKRHPREFSARPSGPALFWCLPAAAFAALLSSYSEEGLQLPTYIL